jgi:hypothetical protein
MHGVIRREQPPKPRHLPFNGLAKHPLNAQMMRLAEPPFIGVVIAILPKHFPVRLAEGMPLGAAQSDAALRCPHSTEKALYSRRRKPAILNTLRNILERHR